MKKILFMLLAVIITIFISGCSKANANPTGQLTLDTIKELSLKGDSLTWSDFENYKGTEVGSGLYIKQYPVEDGYYILIGGHSIKEAPFYIRLVEQENPDNYIDIRTDEVETFLNKSQSAAA